MLVVLPDTIDGLGRLEASLSSATLDRWLRAMRDQARNDAQVIVSLPRFELNPNASLTLSTLLKELGMSAPFDTGQADFTGMGNPVNPNERLFISEAFHKAFVKVDEQGTEAAAATAVTMVEGGSRPQQIIEFKADHSFLFFILDKPSGLILFMGRVTNP
jgi:serpin B